MPTKEAEKNQIILQPKHITVFRFVKKYTQEKIYAPTIKEVSRGTKWSVRELYRILDDLEALGYMTRQKYIERSLKIVKDLV